jgi:hypothetical protein
MARKLSPEKEQEYQELSDFLYYFKTYFEKMDVNDPVHPSNVLKSIASKYGKSKALMGLKMAINDIIEMMEDTKIEVVEKLDQALALGGSITFSELRRRYWSRYKRILKKGKITTEVDYYLIMGILNDTSSGLSDKEIDSLNEMVAKYEKIPVKD